MEVGTEEKSSSPSYYNHLGLRPESSLEEIKRAYRKLAMKWHPDRWMSRPSVLGQAKRKFQQIQEAYSVLSDQRKKALYDAGLYDPEGEEDEGFFDFMDELISLMAQDKREERSYSLEELQTMFLEMAQGFEFSSWDNKPSSFLDEPVRSKRFRCDFNQEPASGSFSTLPGWEHLEQEIVAAEAPGLNYCPATCIESEWHVAVSPFCGVNDTTTQMAMPEFQQFDCVHESSGNIVAFL